MAIKIVVECDVCGTEVEPQSQRTIEQAASWATRAGWQLQVRDRGVLRALHTESIKCPTCAGRFKKRKGN